MAKYLIKEPQILEITKGPNKGEHYLRGILENVDSYYDADRAFTSFEKRVVNDWKKILTPDKGGIAEKPIPEEAIPDKMKYTYGIFAEYVPVAENGFFKKYLTDNPRGKAGDYVRDKEGNPIVYKSMRVFCQYALVRNEETDKIERTFFQGQSVEEVGQKLFGIQCVLVTASNTPATAEDEPEAEPIPPATAEDNKPKTITGYNPETGQPIYKQSYDLSKSINCLIIIITNKPY